MVLVAGSKNGTTSGLTERSGVKVMGWISILDSPRRNISGAAMPARAEAERGVDGAEIEGRGGDQDGADHIHAPGAPRAEADEGGQCKEQQADDETDDPVRTSEIVRHELILGGVRVRTTLT